MPTLYYLDFDDSEDQDDNVCWDALACVSPQHWPGLRAELQMLLTWCCQQGQPGPIEEGALWNFDLQASDTTHHSLPLDWDGHALQGLPPVPTQVPDRVCVSLSLSANPGFADAFREYWLHE